MIALCLPKAFSSAVLISPSVALALAAFIAKAKKFSSSKVFMLADLEELGFILSFATLVSAKSACCTSCSLLFALTNSKRANCCFLTSALMLVLTLILYNLYFLRHFFYALK